MNIVIRADASTRMGSGHVMRCLTLARELTKNGATVEFICRAHEGNLIGLIREQGYIVHPLPVMPVTDHNNANGTAHAKWLGASQMEDADAVTSVLKGRSVDWLVVDHYGLDIHWEEKMRPLVGKIMVIDDLADRKHDCDLLLDQNFYLKTDRYRGLVPEHCVQLIGPKYALLREEFREQRKTLRKRDGQIRKILVFFGGSDPTNETGKVLDALKQLKNSSIQIETIIGLANPHREQLEQQIAQMPNASLHIQVNDMAVRMAEADLMIGAGGSTTWERCCLGLPCLTISIAENQIKAAKDLAKSNYTYYIGHYNEINPNVLFQHIYFLVKNSSLVSKIGENCVSFVNGIGGRIVSSILLTSDSLSKLRVNM